MTTPQEVVEAAADVLHGSRLERARAGVSALNLFSQLSAEDKRELAVLVAQRVAPQLVPRIQAEAGLDMTPEQSRAVLDMVRRLDGNDLAEIQASLGSPDARRAAMTAVGTAAATATGVDDVVREAPDHDTASVRAPVSDDTSEHDRARIRVLEDRVDELIEQVADALRATTEAEARARTAEGEVQAATALAEDAERRAEHLDQTVEDAHQQARQAEERARRLESEARRASVQRSQVVTPVGRARSERSGTSPASGHAGVDAIALAGRMGSGSTSAALRMLVAAAPALRAASVADRHHLVTALPDGWARRKAVQRLVEAGVVTAGEARGLLASLEGVGNQVFAAASMMDAGLVDLDDLADDLAPSALTRLARRVPTT